MKGLLFTGSCRSHQFFGDHGEGTTGTGESSRFAEATKLNRNVAAARDFVNRTWDVWLRDKRFVGRIIKNDRLMFFRVGHPFLKCLSRGDGAGWIIGITQVNEINVFGRQWRLKLVSAETAK